MRASPTDVRGDRTNANATAPTAPMNPIAAARAIPSTNTCRGRNPQGLQDRIGLGFEKALAGQCLAYHGETDQAHEECEEPPTDRLRVYRPLDCRVARIL